MRNIAYQSHGIKHGGIHRMVSPRDVGELIKPFILLDYFEGVPKSGRGFGWHPHSGIATVSLVLDGTMNIKENTGFEGALTKGAVEYMQAGGAVWHTGFPNVGERNQGFQLWVALPPHLEETDAKSHNLQADQVAIKDNVRVILGEYQGVHSPIDAPNDMNYLDVEIKAGESWTYQPPTSHETLWVQQYQGETNEFEEGEVVVFEPSNKGITLHAKGDVKLVLGSAAKYDHELIMGQYSVHTNQHALYNSEKRINEQYSQMIRKGVFEKKVA